MHFIHWNHTFLSIEYFGVFFFFFWLPQECVGVPRAKDQTCTTAVTTMEFIPLSYQRAPNRIFSFFLSFILGPHLWHMEFSRLGFESEM